MGLWGVFLILQFLIPDSVGSGPIVTLLDYSGYFLLGYWIDRADWMKGKSDRWVLLALAIIMINAGGTYLLTVSRGGAVDQTFYAARRRWSQSTRRHFSGS